MCVKSVTMREKQVAGRGHPPAISSDIGHRGQPGGFSLRDGKVTGSVGRCSAKIFVSGMISDGVAGIWVGTQDIYITVVRTIDWQVRDVSGCGKDDAVCKSHATFWRGSYSIALRNNALSEVG